MAKKEFKATLAGNLSHIGIKAISRVGLSKPSIYIPFAGKYPILPDVYEQDKLRKMIYENGDLSDLPVYYQKAVERGNKIAIMEEGFLSWMREKGHDTDDFLTYNAKRKTRLLLKWLSDDCLTPESLNV